LKNNARVTRKNNKKKVNPMNQPPAVIESPEAVARKDQEAATWARLRAALEQVEPPKNADSLDLDVLAPDLRGVVEACAGELHLTPSELGRAAVGLHQCKRLEKKLKEAAAARGSDEAIRVARNDLAFLLEANRAREAALRSRLDELEGQRDYCKGLERMIFEAQRDWPALYGRAVF
jgi:hypothetical protein